MKTKLIALALLIGASLSAQPRGVEHRMEEKKEKIQAMKVAYITRELDLTVEESQSFWPVYNEMQDKEMQLREDQLETFKQLRKSETLSDKELEKALYDVADGHIAVEQLHRDYLPKFIKELGPQKTAKLLRAEKEFGRKVLEEMRGQHPAERRPGGPMGEHPAPPARPM